MRPHVSASALRYVLLSALVIAALLLAACSGLERQSQTTPTPPENADNTTPDQTATAGATIESIAFAATPLAATESTSEPMSTLSPTSAPATATATPTATPRPTRMPRPEPTATATQQAPSPDFLDPYTATLKVLHERGIEPQMPWGQLFLKSSHTYPWLYTFSTTEVGAFNPDTDGFLSWLRGFVGESLSPMEWDEVPSTYAIRDRMILQLHAAIYEPRTPVGQMVRDAEIEFESGKSGQSFTALLMMLFAPAYQERWMSPYFADAIARELQQLTLDYQVAYASSRGYLGFADYLSGIGYVVPMYDEVSQTPQSVVTPTPTRVSPPSNSDDIPREGAVLYSRPLTEWMTGEFEAGWFAVEGREFRIGAWEGAGREWGRTHAAWTNENGFADISASVSVRAITASSSGGCIAVRQDPNAGEYNFCMLSNGRTWATYDAVNANGEWYQEVLLTDEARSGSKAPGEWNRLRIVAKGNQIWFIVNDVVQGTVRHNGRGTGSVAIQVTNWTSESAEWAFDGLVITAVQ